MAQRGIREITGKKLIAKYLPEYSGGKVRMPVKAVLVTPTTSLKKLAKKHPWLKKERLVVKPDQLFGKRGKHKLVLLDADFKQAERFIRKNMNKEVKIGKTKGKLTHFLVEPFVPHEKEYLSLIHI